MANLLDSIIKFIGNRGVFKDASGNVTIDGRLNVKNGQGSTKVATRGDNTYTYVEMYGSVKTLRLVTNGNGNIGLYDPTEDAWIVRNDTSGNTYVGNDSITVGSHSSAIGDVRTAYLTAAKSVTKETATALCSISLPAGTWEILGRVRFPANATGSIRRANITATSGGADLHVQIPSYGYVQQTNFTAIVNPSATTTYYLNVYHDATTSLSFTVGTSAGEINGMRAVRIA